MEWISSTGFQVGITRTLVLGLILIGFVGCDRTKSIPRSSATATPTLNVVSIARVTTASIPLQKFSSVDEIPSIAFPFDGSPGNLRVTLEVVKPAEPGGVPMVNDVLFPVKGRGRLTFTFKNPWPGHDNGRVSLRSESSVEQSEAEFEPELWFNDPGATVSAESPIGEAAGLVEIGQEVLLARYSSTRGKRPVVLSLKATFSKEPIPPRVKAGVKPGG